MSTVAPPLPLPLPDELIERLRRTPQNPRYHAEGSVFNHTVLVLREAETYARLYELSAADYEVLYWAAVLHDIGKPDVTRWESGRWRARGHEAAGVYPAQNILLQHPEISPEQRRRILGLVRWHHVPLRWGLTRKPLEDYLFLATRIDLELLAVFSTCDIRGRYCEAKEKTLNLVQHFKDVIVPEIVARLGSFSEIQDAYARTNPNHRTALWNAFSEREPELLESLLKIPAQRKLDLRSPRCFMTIGSPAAGKADLLNRAYNHLVRIDTRGYSDPVARQELCSRIEAILASGRSVVLYGNHMTEASRRPWMEAVRRAQAVLHYLVFERSNEFLKRKLGPHSPVKNPPYDLPHPWEAHVIEYV